MARRRMRTLMKVIALLLMLISGGVYISTRSMQLVQPTQSSFPVGTIARRLRGTVPGFHSQPTLNPLNSRGFVSNHNTIESPTINTYYNNSFYYIKKSSNSLVKRSKLVDHQTTSTKWPHSAKTKRTSSYDCQNPNTGRQLASENIESNKHRTGYVLALTFREQQTRAADNLFSLQCWAKTLSVHIVEPFMQDSGLLIPMNDYQQKMIRFSDTFDLNAWQGATFKQGFAPIASWEKFLAEAPRELIVVHFRYVHQATRKLRKEQGNRATHLAVDDTYKSGCIPDETSISKIQYLTSKHNFSVVREVCFNFNNGDELTLYQFNTHLFGEFSPKHVTVLMEEWRGLPHEVNGKRVVVYDACWTEIPILSLQYSRPSQKLMCDASIYRHKYLRSDYIAVIVRTEKIPLLTDENSVTQCLNKTLDVWRQVKHTSGIYLTFVSMDVGKYGSKGMKLSDENNTHEAFFKQIYGPHASIKKWEHTFESVTDVRDSGYIASLQKTLVMQARCIVFVGGGSFQRHTKYLYERLHPDRKKQCIQVVRGCTRNMRVV